MHVLPALDQGTAEHSLAPHDYVVATVDHTYQRPATNGPSRPEYVTARFAVDGIWANGQASERHAVTVTVEISTRRRSGTHYDHIVEPIVTWRHYDHHDGWTLISSRPDEVAVYTEEANADGHTDRTEAREAARGLVLALLADPMWLRPLLNGEAQSIGACLALAGAERGDA
ncbi:hypothetical protein EXE59_09790 [Nocardioides eburneiflavus]|uniref:Uncharacterized protein n=1 Tax=Nocardioides eburneiflavus TaxID=2518372 RepID=A0A4Z1CK52_9ACTN|nr:hypothetical protein [Nocardioides eburneiflavus]TGN64210.1 hypothetical protein EXE59_09790 [Nocardioides eburneiflavus]